MVDEVRHWEAYGKKIAENLGEHRVGVLQRRRDKADGWFKALMAGLAFVGVSGAVGLPAATDEVSNQRFWSLLAAFLIILILGLATSFFIYKVASDPLTTSNTDGAALQQWHNATVKDFDRNLTIAKWLAVTLAIVLVLSTLYFALEPRWPLNEDPPKKVWIASTQPDGDVLCGDLTTDAATGQVLLTPIQEGEAATPVPVRDYASAKQADGCPGAK